MLSEGDHRLDALALLEPLYRAEASHAGVVRILEARAAIQIVMGARVRPLGREISRRPARHYVGRVGATLISSSLGLAVYDTQCGAKVFRRNQTLRDVFSRPFISRPSGCSQATSWA